MAYSDGDDFISGALLSFQQATRMKNNWRAAAAVANPSAGMLHSDSDDDYLYHRAAAAWLLVYQYKHLIEYDDERVPVTSIKTGGINDPTFSQWLDDVAGTSPGVYLWWFADQAVAGNEEELFFVVQLPHSYKEGSDIYPHVHWTPSADGGAGEFVKWGLEYAWINIDSDGGDSTIIYSDATNAAAATRKGDAAMVKDRHYKTVIGTIAGAGKTISSMLACRIFRNSSDATDDYTGDAGVLEFDFHIQKESIGSITRYVK